MDDAMRFFMHPSRHAFLAFQFLMEDGGHGADVDVLYMYDATSCHFTLC